MIIIIVGDVHKYLSKFAQEISADASLLTKDSASDLLSGVYYTSLGDINQYRQYTDFLELADKIIYQPPIRWSDTDRKGFSYMKYWTELALQYFYDKKEIENFFITPQKTTALDLVDYRKIDSPQIWIAGGSDSLGVGVSLQERYGQLVADHFNMEASFLTRGRASMAWIADQLLRSDLRLGDIVIFGIVPGGRFTFYHDDKVLDLSPSYYKKNPLFDKIFPLPLLDTDHVNCYQPLTALHQVISICNKVGAQLLIAGLSPTLIDHCIQFPNYINLCHYRFGMDFDIDRKNYFLDFGTDHIHPGPLTHQFYAKNIIAKIQQLRFNLC